MSKDTENGFGVWRFELEGDYDVYYVAAKTRGGAVDLLVREKVIVDSFLDDCRITRVADLDTLLITGGNGDKDEDAAINTRTARNICAKLRSSAILSVEEE